MTKVKNLTKENIVEKIDELLERLKQPDFKLTDYDPYHERRNRFQSWVQPYKR